MQFEIKKTNSQMPSIKFKADTSKNKVNILDVEVLLDHIGKIHTYLYTKRTNSHTYIDYEWCHQKLCKNGIPYGQFPRIRRICSDDDDCIAKSKTMDYHFYLADYPDSLIQSIFERAFLQEHDPLLEPKPDKIDYF